MAQLIYSPRFPAAVEEVFEFIAEHDPGHAAEHVRLIADGVGVLARHPLIGRSVGSGMRELVLGSGRRCYLVLYRFDPATGRVLVLTLRHARQAGYR